MKAIVLAGGTGSRMFPLTGAVNKHLLPVYDKPLIFHPISTAMLAGARDIALVVRSEHLGAFQALLGDGAAFGICLTYVVQDEPLGIADAMLRCEEACESQETLLILGDNILHGPLLGESLRDRVSKVNATIFSYQVSDPREYACVEIDAFGQPTSLIEKPLKARSGLAVPGIYFLPPDAFQIARSLRPSSRGELEITDLNNVYLHEGRLVVVPLPRGTAWIDAGSPDALNDASNYVRLLQQRQGLPIACPEEIALTNGWLGREELLRRIATFPGTAYSQMLDEVLSKSRS
jgi:glucose-1-phosphate thymidylyltransferase